jgi:hypothetical protein
MRSVIRGFQPGLIFTIPLDGLEHLRGIPSRDYPFFVSFRSCACLLICATSIGLTFAAQPEQFLKLSGTMLKSYCSSVVFRCESVSSGCRHRFNSTHRMFDSALDFYTGYVQGAKQ